MIDFDFKTVLRQYTKHKIWFLAFILTFVCSAYLYTRYTTPTYLSQTKIKILDEKTGATGATAFKELNLFSGAENNVEDEIEVLGSRSNFLELVKSLGINKRIYHLGDIKKSELYDNPPFKINTLASDSIIFSKNSNFFITIKSKTQFEFRENNSDLNTEYAFGKTIVSELGNIIFTPSENITNFIGEKFEINFEKLSKTAQDYRNKISIVKADKFSNVLTILIQDPVKKKSIDVLNTLVSIYNRNAVLDKKEIANKTSSFINERINLIYSNLSQVDSSAQNFKTSRGLTDISSQANINLNIGAANQQELANLQNQLNIASSMKDYVDDQKGFELLPSNIGLSDPSITNITSKYNQLVQERNRLLKSSNEKNPIIVNMDDELKGLKSSLSSSLNTMNNNLALTANNLSGQQSRINSKIYSAPSNERALRDITRKQETTETLYLYLLQKREEAQISVASASPKSKIIDYAFNTSESPVYPKKSIIYIGAILFGFLIPFGSIYFMNMIDNKILNKDGLEKLTKDFPVLAELPRIAKKQNKILSLNDRSVLGESFRILRTNLDYLISSKKNVDNNNIIFVTSSISGEGKTFVSSNLAMVFASTGKKVLLVGADIRNPKIYSFFTDKNIDVMGNNKKKLDIGLVDYLNNESLNVKDITNSLLVYSNYIDVIYSGKILPNPAELMLSKRFDELFAEVSHNYDYVIVDTAPLMLVTDTLLISKYASQTIYVTRADNTETKVIDFPINLHKEGKINGLSFVVNDVKNQDLGYGKKYGYGYGVVEKKWWQIFT